MPVNPIYHHTEDKLMKELQRVKYAKEDPRGFEPLYNKYYEQIFRYIYQRMDDKEMAYDVTSQVFLKALNNIHKYEYRGVPFASWLYRIAKSELYQSFRDKKARRTVNVESMNLFEMIDEMEEDRSDENRQVLLSVIRDLSEEDVQMVELRFFEKRSFREIGEILDITENNAKVKSHRVVKKMKKLFKEIDYEK
ncbi:MAG: sigma-70 family RNA polymerase sigma factor [Flavobacteriales bacterium]|nr:sigma-70 family RNA polymerase sigma factor [Flavobacteriales bacterium]